MKAPTLLGAAALLAAAACQSALAQDAAAQQQLAAKPFTIVAPFPPGGPVDALARLLSTGLAERYKQTSVVENKPGANGNIGIDMVKRAAPDGHTLLVVPQGNLTINPTLLARPGYSVETDFAPVASLAKAANVIAVHPGVPAKTVQELVALSKARPATISYASPGVGSSLHLAGELFKQQTGADILHVAYKGTAPGLNDVLGGTVPMIVGNVPALLPHVQSGKLRALAVTDPARSKYLPEVPTLAQAGVPGIAISSWYGVMAPKKTPPAVLKQLEKDIQEIFSTPAVVRQLDLQGIEPWVVTGSAFGELIRKETATWVPVIKAANVTPQ
ncbi:tripartite tricarboxylate transporter substrate binding protein [Delftia sp.]|uniref:Bug family tripartite tricarboxylate transporter substrate binding protein n=1 Tax=Delftia sp. TaxID=1886637 RepID=UPI00259CE3D1|nr:tripartite tricarboxylate transporter substrate binding protein [Delftia sp.]